MDRLINNYFSDYWQNNFDFQTNQSQRNEALAKWLLNDKSYKIKAETQAHTNKVKLRQILGNT